MVELEQKNMKDNIKIGSDLKPKYTKDEEISDLSNLLYEQDILISYLEKKIRGL